MNRVTMCVIATVIAVVAIFYTGRVYERRANVALQVEQLKRDAIANSKIEEKSDADKERIRVVVKTITEELPEWSSRKLPDNVLLRLHDAGL